MCAQPLVHEEDAAMAEPVKSARPAPQYARVLLATAVVLVLWCWAIYLPVVNHEFLEYDDAGYVVDNEDVHQGLTLELLKNSFTKLYLSNYHPLTMLSYGADISLFGLNSGYLHAVNVAFHILNVLLLLGLTWRLTGSAYISAFVAALFAVHPQHVEPVAWLASRKDVLSTAFLLALLHFYISFARTGRKRWYALVLIALTLGLLSKQMLVTMPVLLLLLDWWPLKRLRTPPEQVACLVEKVPISLICGGMALATYYAQSAGGATNVSLSLWDRASNVLIAYSSLISGTFAPVGLTAFYPRWTGAAPAQVLPVAVLLIAVTATALILRRRAPELLFGWAWFVISLLPVSGIIPLGAAVTADRYTYVPHIGLFLAGAVLVSRMVFSGVVLRVSAVAVLAGCSMAAAAYVPCFKNDITVFSRSLALTRPDTRSLINLGISYQDRGWFDEALHCYHAAFAIAPHRVDLLHNIGIAEARRGAVHRARDAFQRLVLLKPGDEVARQNLVSMQSAVDEVEATLHHLEGQVDVHPNELLWRRLLLIEYLGAGLYERVIDQYKDPLDLPQLVAAAHLHLGEFDQAITWYRTAVESAPDAPTANFSLIRALTQAGRIEEAREQYARMRRATPDFAPVIRYGNDHGW